MDKIHKSEIVDTFPLRIHSFVHSTFPGDAKFKPQLQDPGSCMVPLGFTVTIDQWKNQQQMGDNPNAYWCGFVVSTKPTSAKRSKSSRRI